MKTDIDLESKVIKRFINRSKQDRYLMFIKQEKRKRKFIQDIATVGFLQENLFDELIGNERDFIRNRIEHLGKQNDCYVISQDQNIDTMRLDIDIAISETIGADMGTLLVFGDAEILYCEGEGFSNRLISRRNFD